MKKIQKEFFVALQEIQDLSVNIMLCNVKSYENMEDILFDVTYDTIYKIMELIDGYSKKNLQLDIIERNTLESVRNGIELHDTCAEFLRYSNI